MNGRPAPEADRDHADPQVSADRLRREDRSRLDRVRAVVRAAARVQDPSDPLGREARARIPRATGLSAPSVEIALAEHLEAAPSDADLTSLLARAGSSPRCHVILSANVCTAAVRAIAIACATSPSVLAKPSRRDPVIAEIVARALDEDGAFADAGGSIAIVSEIAPAPLDELHVYGSDETIARVRAGLPAGVIVRAHGAGFGVAIVDRSIHIEDAAPRIARDVIAFDQRGCLSPRVAIAIGSADRANDLARALADDLAGWHQRAPRGALRADEAAELRRYVDTATALGAAITGDGFAVGVDESPSALLLPPSARAVHVLAATEQDLPRLLADVAPKIAAIGFGATWSRDADLVTIGFGATWSRDANIAAGGHGGRRSEATETRDRARADGGATSAAPQKTLEIARKVAPGARVSPLGFMQRPPLDGPVDLRDETRPITS